MHVAYTLKMESPMMRPDISEEWRRRKPLGSIHIYVYTPPLMVTELSDRKVSDCVKSLCWDLDCDFMTNFCTRDGADIFYPDFYPDNMVIGRLQ